jgi:hypothetical protein
MRLLLVLGLVLFVVLYLVGAVLIAWTWWLSGRPRVESSGDPKIPRDVPEAPGTRAA